MIWLLLKILGMLVLSALLGWMARGWWRRGRFVQVTDEFSNLRRNFSDVNARLSGAETELARERLRIRDLETKRLEGLRKAELLKQRNIEMDGLRNEVLELRRTLGTYEEQVHALNRSLEGGRTSLKSAMATRSALDAKLASMRAESEKIVVDREKAQRELLIVRAELEELKGRASGATRDQQSRFEQLMVQISDLQSIKGTLEAQRDDMSQRLRLAEEKVEKLDRAVSSRSAPSMVAAEGAVDLGANPRASTRRDRDVDVVQLGGRLAEADATLGRPRLYQEPPQVRPDDLKRISGVGPKLEGMLHELGVYFFWQVAEWGAFEVAFVDAQLEVFKGRIERDGWVDQAKELAADSTAVSARVARFLELSPGADLSSMI